MRKQRRFMRWWMIPVVISVVVFLLFRYVLFFGYVPTVSMQPTLNKGSYLIASRIYFDLKVGNIILFWHEGERLVKRIAAAPGDTVNLDALTYMKDVKPPDRVEQVFLVPEGCYYVLGDNAGSSVDSRYWENQFVKKEEIIGVMTMGAKHWIG